jgi:AcrR family transcriptional regulator
MSRMPIGPDGTVETVAAVPDTRDRIAGAAFELFTDRGYDGTTVDAIAERAGIARRTFFRYFRSKDDVIFPDHDSLLATVQLHLQGSAQRSPIEAICGGVRLVFTSYVDDAAVSVQRYRLTRSIQALRDRELASVRRYERAFGKYVRERLAGDHSDAEAALRADVMAASVVAAHNAVLREWLRAGGTYDPAPDLEAAFAWVASTVAGGTAAGGASPPPGAPGTGADDAESAKRPAAKAKKASSSPSDDVVVAVFRADQPIGDVVEKITRSL